MKPIARIAFVITLSVLTGCSSSNIKVGDFDYPVANKKPNKMLSIKGSMPLTLEVELTAHYSPKDGGIYNRTTGGLVCGYTVGWGAQAPYMVDVPIPIARNATNYVASFPIDMFQEGRCGWHLSSLTYSASKRKLKTRVGYNTDLLRAWVDGAGFAGFKLKKWCTARSDGTNTPFLDCEPSATNRLVEFVPTEKRNYVGQDSQSLDTQTIEIDFNDLDGIAVRE